jgi:16S rRNA (guanine1207-N2)-methyltransferase
VAWSDLTLDAVDVAGMDVVLTNPPFHVGRRVVGALSAGFVAAAEAALRPGGRLWLVANAALPFDRLLSSWRGLADVTPPDVRGYRVYSAARP